MTPADTTLSRWNDYEERIQRVIDYIYDHLDEDLDLNRLAEVACVSPYHWHRIYHAVLGETAAVSVRRLRLQRAASELAHGAHAIAKIAAIAGYPSVSSFSRVFRVAYGMPPAQYRKQGSHTQFTYSLRQGDPKMFEVTLRTFPPMQAATLEHRGSYLGIGKEFEKLFGWFGMRGLLKPDTRSIGIYYDDPNAVPEPQLRSRAGVIVDSAPALTPPMELTPVHGGEYAVLRHKGPYSDLHSAYQWFYGTWLPQSGKQVADAPIVEEYLNDPRDTPPTELLTDICLPLR